MGKPTPVELQILQVLWQRGPSTVREVYEALGDSKRVGYTSVLKLLQIMTTKGLVHRDEAQRAHVYEAAEDAGETRQQLVADFLERVFEGSASQLMMHALAAKQASAEEIDALKKLLAQHERNRRR